MSLGSYGMDAAEAAFVNVFMFVLFGIYLLIVAFSILSYVLTARGMQVIAKRRGIRHGWLAWLPIGNVWILGSISDQYQYVVKGKVRNRRKLLLIFNLLLVFGGLPLYFISGVSATNQMNSMNYINFAAVGTFLLVTLGTALLILALTIVQAVFMYMAYYDLYASCEPKNAVVYLLLSIFVSVTSPFFVFSCRNKDLGMPPRKTEQPDPVLKAPEELPAAEVPAAEVPVEEAPAAEEAVVEVPAVEDAVAEVPVEETVVEVPAVEEPAAEEASASEEL